jgi:2,5-dichloro-2,5-cyclohexadiene-1,4-diol dehydrogenase 2
MGRLDGKIALISGAASGMGAAQARLFAREGARVVGGDIQAELGQQVASEINSAGGEAIFVRLDVADQASWQAAVSTAVESFGGLTTLINTAGIFEEGSLSDTDYADWERTVAVDQTSVFLGMRAALPALLASGNGAIVNVSSLLSVRGVPNSFSYHASKGAVSGMTRAAAVELARSGIRVNAILPGLILTPMTTVGDRAAGSEALRNRIPMGEGGEPEDIAYATLFLASDESKYITGVELLVDGGWAASA